MQAGKTDFDAQRDEFDCENVIVTKHGGWQRVEPFTAGMEKALDDVEAGAASRVEVLDPKDPRE